MKRPVLVAIAVLSLAVGCGGDDENNANNGSANNGSANNGSNNGTANNGSNNGTANNGSNNGTAGTNNGTAGTNNGTAGTNNGTGGTNNGTAGTNNGNPGAISVQSSIVPNQGPVGTEVTHTFTELENVTLDPDNIGGDHVDGFGHYHVYVDVVDEDHQLLESGASPDTFTVEIASEVLTPGAHNLIFKVHKNDHTEYSNPIEYSIPFTVTE